MKKIILSGIILGGMLMFPFAGSVSAETIFNNDGSTVDTVTGIITNGDGTINGGPVTDVCSSNSMRNVTGIINWASCLLIKTIVPFLFALATVAFIWGVIQFYLNPENEEKRKKGKSFIIGGLIALFVMVAMWGLVSVLTTTFDVKNTIPQLPGQ